MLKLSKKAEVTTEQIILLVLVIIVLIGAIIFIATQAGPNALEWIKNLPGVKQVILPEEKALDEAQQKLLNSPIVGHIAKPEDIKELSGEQRYIYLIMTGQTRDAILTGLYFTNEKVQDNALYGDIYMSLSGFDEKIGEIDTDRVKITIDAVKYTSLKDQNKIKHIPDFSLVKKYLDQSKSITMFLYKSNQVFLSEKRDLLTKIDDLNSRGYSKYITIEFTDLWGYNDYIDVAFNFQLKKTQMLIRINGKENENCKDWVDDQDIICMDYIRNSKDIREEDKKTIFNILYAKNPSELASTMSFILNSRKDEMKIKELSDGFFQETIMRDVLGVSENVISDNIISNLLYGLDVFPSDEEIAKLRADVQKSEAEVKT